jgi:hypothetical protein
VKLHEDIERLLKLDLHKYHESGNSDSLQKKVHEDVVRDGLVLLLSHDQLHSKNHAVAFDVKECIEQLSYGVLLVIFITHLVDALVLLQPESLLTKLEQVFICVEEFGLKQEVHGY